MMGDRKVDQAALFYEFSLERHVPADHLLGGSIDQYFGRAPPPQSHPHMVTILQMSRSYDNGT